jgi:hypothetical protein
MCIGIYDFLYLCHLIFAVADPARRIVDMPVPVRVWAVAGTATLWTIWLEPEA